MSETTQVNFTEIVNKVKAKLPEYMALHNIHIDSDDHFLCPFHTDTTPSAHFIPGTNKVKWHCFPCAKTGDIYDMAESLDHINHKIDGFIKTTRFLMNKFDDLRDIETIGVKKEDEETANIRRINLHIANMLRNTKTLPNQLDFAIERGWNEKTCSNLCIGTLPWIKVKESVEATLGIDISTEPYRKIFMKPLFSSRGLTITLFDHHDEPIAFTTRNIDYVEKDKTSSPKYMNSCDIPGVFHKEKHLFHIAKAVKAVREKGYLYIFEGNANVITAWQNGIYNTTAICGVAFTDKQIELLVEKLSIHYIVLCLDNDTAGNVTTKKFLNDYKYLNTGLHVEIVEIPLNAEKSKCDPDYFIKTYGADAFDKLPKLTAFEWLLSKTAPNARPDEVIKEMIPHIALTSMRSSWDIKIKQLAEYTGVNAEFITQDVLSYHNQEEVALQNDRRKIIESAYNHARDGRPDAKDIFQEAITSIQLLENKKSKTTDSIAESTEFLDDMFEEYANYNPDTGMTGWDTGYQSLNTVFDGIPKQSAYFAFPGLPHVGKSAFLLNIVTRMLMLTDEGKNQDLNVYFMTIDDPKKVVITRMAAIITGYEMREIQKLAVQNNYAKEAMVKAHARIKQWMIKGHLSMEDSSFTIDLTTGINNMIKQRKLRSEKGNLFILDNFHKLAAPYGYKERHAWIQLSKIIHERVVADRFTALATFELNKNAHSNDRASAQDISETGCIEYDAQGIVICENYFYKQSTTKYKYLQDGVWYPIFEARVTKNKINEYKRNLYFKFNTSNTQMEEINDINLYIGDNNKLVPKANKGDILV